jgi:hypothetical protein
LSDDNILLWRDFESRTDDETFDFIFHDMGDPTTRIPALPTMTRRLAPDGLLILDDMHKPHYYPHALRILGDDWIVESIVDLSLDSLGRFAYVAKRAVASAAPVASGQRP